MADIALVAFINLLLWAVCFSFCVKCQLPLYHPTVLFCLYFFLGYVTRPFLIVWTGESHLWQYIGFWPSTEEVLFSCLCSSLCLLIFVFGPYVIQPQWYAQSTLPPLAIRVGNKRRFALFYTFIVCLGLIALSGAYGGAGESEVLAYDIDVDARGGQRLVGTSGYATAAADFLPICLLLGFLIYGFSRHTLLLVLPFVFIRFWVGAGRNAFLLLIFGIICAHLVREGRRYPRARMLAIGFIAFIFFDVIGSDRLAVRKLFVGDTTIAQIFADYLENRGRNAGTADFSEFDVATALYSIIPDLTGYNWFSQYLRILIWPIPRQLWPDKPVITSLIDVNSVGNYFALTWSLGVDLYSNFGVASLILGALAISCTLSWLVSRVNTSPTPTLFVTYWAVAMYFPLLFRDGAPMYVYMTGLSLIAAHALRVAGAFHLERLPMRERMVVAEHRPDDIGLRESKAR